MTSSPTATRAGPSGLGHRLGLASASPLINRLAPSENAAVGRGAPSIGIIGNGCSD